MTTEKNLIENLGYDEYRAHPAIANSDLNYIYSPKLFRLRKDGFLDKPESEAFRLGKMIDRYLLDYENFNKYYQPQPEVKTPSHPNQVKFADLVFEGKDPVEAYKASYKDKGDAANKREAEKLNAALGDYIESLHIFRNYITYTAEEGEMLNRLRLGTLNHKIVSKLFYEDESHIKKHLQIIGMPYEGILWKGELDFVKLDFDNKEIVLLDLKSTTTIEKFQYSIFKYNYDRQLALYLKLLKYYLVEKNIFSEFEMSEYLFKVRILAVEKNTPNDIYLIPIPHTVLNLGEEKLKKGASDIKFYNKHGWDHPRSYIENNGLYVLEWNI